ncbi:MAG: RNA 2',3'-cyclic phosphodiesterase, partial [Planctomycetota bacterium]
ADDQVEAVCSAAGTVAGQVGPFELRLGQCGCFPLRGRVRIVHAGVADLSAGGSLQRCRDLCEAAFAELGFARENRPFTPHLTVGRVKEDRTQGRLRAAAEQLSCETVTQSVKALYVVQSVLSPSGARYSNVVGHRLTGTD